MAGSLSLSAAQRFDRNGKPLAGGELHFFAANTSTPQNAYKDTALTLPHPNPIKLDAYGNIPEFYVADGSIGVRLTDSSGVVMFESLNMLVVGPSAGTGSGTAVDATTIFQTGDPIFTHAVGTRAGWVRANGRTIGSATSGATERANADCQALFVWIWTNIPDFACPVSGGRGATALADFNGLKQITLPDMRGRAPFGFDDMGNANASRITAATITTGGPGTAGSFGGEQQHILTDTELASHDHGGVTGSTAVTINSSIGQITRSAAGGATNYFSADGSGTPNSAGIFITSPAHSHVIAGDGGNGAHNNMPPFMLGTWYLKL